MSLFPFPKWPKTRNTIFICSLLPNLSYCPTEEKHREPPNIKQERLEKQRVARQSRRVVREDSVRQAFRHIYAAMIDTDLPSPVQEGDDPMMLDIQPIV
jgi:hypothetical protein